MHARTGIYHRRRSGTDKAADPCLSTAHLLDGPLREELWRTGCLIFKVGPWAGRPLVARREPLGPPLRFAISRACSLPGEAASDDRGALVASGAQGNASRRSGRGARSARQARSASVGHPSLGAFATPATFAAPLLGANRRSLLGVTRKACQ